MILQINAKSASFGTNCNLNKGEFFYQLVWTSWFFYQLVWTSSRIRFKVDGIVDGTFFLDWYSAHEVNPKEQLEENRRAHKKFKYSGDSGEVQ